MRNDSKLVFSTDPNLNIKCSKCKELQLECICLKEDDVSHFKGPILLSLEKNHRGGKIVTVISRLPSNEEFLKKVTSELKKTCGAGGTYLRDPKNSKIEIQGDKKEMIRKFFEKKEILVKG